MKKKYIKIYKLEFKDIGTGWVLGLFVFLFALILSLFIPYPLNERYLRAWLWIFLGFWIGVFFSLLEIKSYKVRVKE
ncbi:hypothetical protein J7L49_06675 [Candidatus Bathyarchaeota archaeon]|nr:hypothetical protein [Candidatus Bathyarchaeota archaeon]